MQTAVVSLEHKHAQKGFTLAKSIRYAAKNGAGIKSIKRAARNLYVRPDGKYTIDNKHYPVKVDSREAALAL